MILQWFMRAWALAWDADGGWLVIWVIVLLAIATMIYALAGEDDGPAANLTADEQAKLLTVRERHPERFGASDDDDVMVW